MAVARAWLRAGIAHGWTADPIPADRFANAWRFAHDHPIRPRPNRVTGPAGETVPPAPDEDIIDREGTSQEKDIYPSDPAVAYESGVHIGKHPETKPLAMEEKSPGGLDGFLRPAQSIRRESKRARPVKWGDRTIYLLIETPLIFRASRTPGKGKQGHRPSSPFMVRQDIALSQSAVRELADETDIAELISEKARAHGRTFEEVKRAGRKGTPDALLRADARVILKPIWKNEQNSRKSIADALGWSRSMLYRLMGEGEDPGNVDVSRWVGHFPL
jgi:hypothetical protein